MLEWTLLWAVLKYRQRKCVKNCTIRTKLLNMASGMRLFWNFRNCFNPINFLFRLYICCVFMHTLLSTQWFSWMLRWNLCDKSTNGCTQIFLYRPNVIATIICNCRHNIESFKTEVFTTVFERIIRSLFIASTVKISSDGKSFHPINYIYPCILPLL